MYRKDVDKWVKEENLNEKVATDMFGPSFVFKYPLQEASNYKIKVQVFLRDGSSESEYYEFVTNEAPIHKDFLLDGCTVDPDTGEAVITEFNIVCEGFVDVDQPLSYDFSYHKTTGEVHFQSGLSPNASVRLPLGDPIADYTIPISVTVTDSLGASTFGSLVVIKVGKPDTLK